MKFLLDTNAWIKLLNQQSSAIKNKIMKMNPEIIFLCSVVKSELYFGAYKSSRMVANLDLLNKLFNQFESFDFTDKAAEICGSIRAELIKKGTPIGPYDLQIAGIALENNLTLVTHNTSEFSRVTGLRIEDWESSY